MHYLGRYTLLAAVLALATTACTLAGSTEADLLAEAERDLDWLKGIRRYDTQYQYSEHHRAACLYDRRTDANPNACVYRELHKIPELKYEEVKTSEFVR